MERDKEREQIGFVVKEVAEYRFSTEDLLGSGYSSKVYKGTHTTTQEVVAIKVVQLNRLKSSLQEKLLSNEVKAVKTIKHPNVIMMIEVYQTSNNVYFVSEFCEGDLASVIKACNGPMDEGSILKFTEMMFNGLTALHSKAIIHRDIKPANFLVKEGVLKVADLGFCEFLCERNGDNSYGVGSPLYMSPEAYKKSLYSFKSDIWACGISIYEMILGSQPFKGMNYDGIMTQLSDPSFFYSIKTSEFLRMLLQRMLTIELESRMSLEECRSLLQKHLNGEPALPRPVSQRSNQHRGESPALTFKRPSSAYRDSSCNSSRSIKIVVSRLPSVQKPRPLVVYAPLLGREHHLNMQSNTSPPNQQQVYQRKAIFQNLFPRRTQQPSLAKYEPKQEVKQLPKQEVKQEVGHRLLYKLTEELIQILTEVSKYQSFSAHSLKGLMDQQCKLFINKLIHHYKVNNLDRAELKTVINRYHSLNVLMGAPQFKSNAPKSFYHKQILPGYKKCVQECLQEVQLTEWSLHHLLHRHFQMLQMFQDKSSLKQIQDFLQNKEN